MCCANAWVVATAVLYIVHLNGMEMHWLRSRYLIVSGGVWKSSRTSCAHTRGWMCVEDLREGTWWLSVQARDALTCPRRFARLLAAYLGPEEGYLSMSFLPMSLGAMLEHAELLPLSHRDILSIFTQLAEAVVCE